MTQTMDAVSIDWSELKRRAEDVRQRAYAPYSEFFVGAALLTAAGNIFVGANVENASYGLSLCAERSAVATAVAAGEREFVAIAIVAPGNKPITPCGMCRQVLHELAPNLPVQCHGALGGLLETSTAALLPHAFVPNDLGGKDL